MGSSNRLPDRAETIGRVLQQRHEAIAIAWFETVTGSGFLPSSPKVMRQQFRQLTTAIIDYFRTPTPERKTAVAIGQKIAQLRVIQPDTLGNSQTLLAQQLNHGIPPQLQDQFYHYLSILLGGIGVGFFQHARQTILDGQEQIRQANLIANRQLQATLHRSKERYRGLFENSPISLWEENFSAVKSYVDAVKTSGVQDLRHYFQENPDELEACAQKLEIIDVNQATIDLYKAESKKDLATNLTRIFNTGSFHYFLDEIIAVSEGKQFYQGEAVNQTLDGETIQVLLRWSVAPGSETTYSNVLVSILDITRLKRTTAALRRHSERLQILHDLDRAILAAHSPEEIAAAALERLERLIPASNSAVILFHLDSREGTVITGALGEYTSQERYPLSNWQAIEKLATGTVHIVNDIRGEQALSAGLRELLRAGMRSLMAVPLRVQDELIGALAFVSEKRHIFTDEYKEIAQEVAAPLAIAIQNANLFTAEHTARQQAETLQEVAAVLSASLDEEEVANLVLGQLARVVQYDSASVMLVQDNQLTVTAYHGNYPESIHHVSRSVADLPLANDLLKQRIPIIIDDTQTDPRWVSITENETIRSWLGVPLVSQNEAIGLLTLDNSQPGFYNQQHEVLVTAFANQAVLAIENARLYNRTQRYAVEMEHRVEERTRELSALYDITAVANQYLDLNSILSQSVTRIIAALDCYAVAIHTRSTSSPPALSLAHCSDVPEPIADFINHPVTKTHLIAAVLNHDTPLVIPDLKHLSWPVPLQTPLPLQGYCGNRMQARNQTLGVLSVFGQPGQQFNVEEIALLSSIADHIGVAVENARLRQRSEELAVVKERDRLARELHDSVTQSLYSLTLFAEAAGDRIDTGEINQVDEYVHLIGESAQQALKEMRLMLYELRSQALISEGLIPALRRRLDAVEGRAGMETHLDADPNLEIPDLIEEGLYRIVQEALNNTLKHAGASTVTVSLDRENGRLVLQIKDNGRGFDTAVANQQGGGMGLDIMRERSQKLGGTFKITSETGQGTEITVTVNLNG